MGRSVALPPGNTSHPQWSSLTLAFTGHNTGESVSTTITNVKTPGTNDATITGSITRSDSLGIVDANANARADFTAINCGGTGSGFTIMWRAKLATLTTNSMILGKNAGGGYIWFRKSANTLEYSPAASTVAGTSMSWTLTDANYTSQRDYCLVSEAESGGLAATKLYQKATTDTTWTLVSTVNSVAAGNRTFSMVGDYQNNSGLGFSGEIEYLYIFKDTPLSLTTLNANFSDPYDIVSATSVTLTAQSAANGRVKIKKSSGTYTLTLAGSYTGVVTGIEYRLGPSGTWTTLVSSVSGGTFSQSITIDGTTAFQGITIRATNDTSKTSSDPDFTIAHEIWLLAVDSLAAGRLTNAQTHTGGTYKSYCYTSGSGWLTASDGVGIPDAAAGSHWPLLANLLREDRIVCFIQSAASGQKLTGKRSSTTTTLINNSGCGGLTGILVHGGANDAAQSETTTDSAAAWSTEVQAYADSYATSYPGCKTWIHLCPDVSDLTSVDARANAIRKGVQLAAAANANVKIGANIWWLDFTVDNLHPKTNAEGQAVAEAWWSALRTNATATPAPLIVDAKHNSAKTTVTLRFDRSLKSGSLSTNCFRVTDNGAPVTISSAVASGTFVTLTLASAASGTLVANMGWGETPSGTPPQSGVATTNLYGDYYRPAEPFYDLSVAPTDATAPTLASAAINTAGTICTLSFTEVDSAPILPVGAVTGFSIAASAGAVSIAAASRTDNTTIVLALSRVILASETVTVSYSSGNVTDSAETPNSLATITNSSVTNNSTATAGGGGSALFLGSLGQTGIGVF